MTKLEQLLNSMGNDFESSNFEEVNHADQINVAGNAIQKLHPHEQRAIISMMASSKNDSGITRKPDLASAGDVNSLVAQSVGDLNLTVTRNGVAVNATLPFIIFGANDSLAKYASTLPNLLTGLPTGTTVAVTTNAAGDFVFTYTDGSNVDTVTVKNLGNVNYQSFISAMQNNFFATKYFLISVTDEDFATQQFAQPLVYGVLSALGMTGANQLVLRSRTNSWMFRKDRIEVVMPEQTVVPDFSMSTRIIKADAFSIGFDFFMSARTNLNKVGVR